MVLLTEIDEVQDAVLTAEKVIETMAQPHVVSGHQLHVTFSIGISIYPDDGRDVEAMLRNADTAMYQAKKTGRNHYHLYHPGMNARAVARQSVEQTLHRALEEGGFVLHYQPKVNLETGAITGSEALIRILGAAKQLVYSSLSYLLRFPIDTLKIDQSFVQDLENDTGGSGEAIVSAVIGMGTSLKQRVVAEGIETRQQLAFLQSHHCAEGQGYYFSRPVPAAEFASYLNQPHTV